MTKKLVLGALFFFLSCLNARAQNANIHDIALGDVTQVTALGNISYTTPLSGASITVCGSSGIGIPCSPALPGLCSSQTDSVCQQANPLSSDTSGNYSFWVPGGATYVVTIVATGFSSRVIIYSAPLDPTAPVKILSSLTVSGSATVGGNASVTGTLFAGGVTISSFPSGRCVQTTSGGAFTYTAASCGTSSGTVTVTGSPVSGQCAFWSGGSSITGSTNCTYAALTGFLETQGANNADTFLQHRFTDSSPSGYFYRSTNSTGSTNLYIVDVLGNILGTSFNDLLCAPNQAQSGIVRLCNLDSISWRNNAGTGDIALSKNTSDQLTFGGNITPTISGAVTPGDLASFLNSGQIQDAGVIATAVPKAVASGTATMNSGNLNSPQCYADVIVSAPGTVPSGSHHDKISWAYEGTLTSPDTLMYVNAEVTTDNVIFSRCNLSGAARVGTAVIVNWTVLRTD